MAWGRGGREIMRGHNLVSVGVCSHYYMLDIINQIVNRVPQFATSCTPFFGDTLPTTDL